MNIMPQYGQDGISLLPNGYDTVGTYVCYCSPAGNIGYLFSFGSKRYRNGSSFASAMQIHLSYQGTNCIMRGYNAETGSWGSWNTVF